eukprot:m.11683 g.11683  ORF g.11683 m.11683 type:complete len:584 (+) comp8927_c0_seq1:115-1866(+)
MQIKSTMASKNKKVAKNDEKPPLSTYQLMAIVAGCIYLSLYFVIYYPPLFTLLSRGPDMNEIEQQKLRKLLFAVSPIGLEYIAAAQSRENSAIGLTILWRLLIVGPWIYLSYIRTDAPMDWHDALLIASLDVGFPILALIINPTEALNLIPNLVAVFKVDSFKELFYTPGSIVQTVAKWESSLGFILLQTMAYIQYNHKVEGTEPDHSDRFFLAGFPMSVLSLHYLMISWKAKKDCETKSKLMNLPVRIFVGLAIVAWELQSDHNDPFAIHNHIALTFWTIGSYTYFYSAFYKAHDWDQSSSIFAWFAQISLFFVAISIVWDCFSPFFHSESATTLAFAIHRQDLLIGIFIPLCGLLLDQFAATAPMNVTAISWLLPFAGIWFTVETKLLANLDGGSPFHPSWPVRELGPVYCADLDREGYWLVDLTFSIATILMTAVGTTWTALVLLYITPKTKGYLRLTTNGVLIILTSCIWMILASSGVPAIMKGWTFPPAIPPPIGPVDAIAAVNIHIRDLVTGIVSIAAGIAATYAEAGRVTSKSTTTTTATETNSNAEFAITWMLRFAWLLSIIPKLALHIWDIKVV